MDITKCITDNYVLAKMDTLPSPSSIIGKELYRAYQAGYREYELFYDQDNKVEYILCLWASLYSYTAISKHYPEFFSYKHSCYLPTDTITPDIVGSFCVWDKFNAEWVTYKPRLR